MLVLLIESRLELPHTVLSLLDHLSIKNFASLPCECSDSLLVRAASQGSEKVAISLAESLTIAYPENEICPISSAIQNKHFDLARKLALHPCFLCQSDDKKFLWFRLSIAMGSCELVKIFFSENWKQKQIKQVLEAFFIIPETREEITSIPLNPEIFQFVIENQNISIESLHHVFKKTFKITGSGEKRLDFKELVEQMLAKNKLTPSSDFSALMALLGMACEDHFLALFQKMGKKEISEKDQNQLILSAIINSLSKVTKKFFEMGISPNTVVIDDPKEDTFFHKVLSLPLFKVFLQFGGLPFNKNRNGETPLFRFLESKQKARDALSADTKRYVLKDLEIDLKESIFTITMDKKPQFLWQDLQFYYNLERIDAKGLKWGNLDSSATDYVLLQGGGVKKWKLETVKEFDVSNGEFLTFEVLEDVFNSFPNPDCTFNFEGVKFSFWGDDVPFDLFLPVIFGRKTHNPLTEEFIKALPPGFQIGNYTRAEAENYLKANTEVKYVIRKSKADPIFLSDIPLALSARNANGVGIEHLNFFWNYEEKHYLLYDKKIKYKFSKLDNLIKDIVPLFFN